MHEATRAGVAVEMDESRRKKLREIELKVAEYAEKLEAKGAGKKGMNIAEKCDHYRAKLLEVRFNNLFMLIIPLVFHCSIIIFSDIAVVTLACLLAVLGDFLMAISIYAYYVIDVGLLVILMF